MNDYDSVITKTGARLHISKNEGTKTLCGKDVFYRREGLQWNDPKVRAFRTCQVCTNKAGVGIS